MTQDRFGAPPYSAGSTPTSDTHVRRESLDGAGRVLGSAAFDADTRPAVHGALLGWLGGSRRFASSASAWREPAPTARASPTAPHGCRRRRRRCEPPEPPDAPPPRHQSPTPTTTRRQRHGPRSTSSAAVVPKSADGCVEAIRTLRVARRSAVKARTVAANQIDAVVVTAPEPVKDRLRALNTARTVEACARMRPGTDGHLVRAAASSGRCAPWPAAHQALTAEIKHLDAELRRLCERANPALLGRLRRRRGDLRPRCSSPPATTPSGCASPRRPSPPCASHQPHRGVLRPNGATTGSTAAATEPGQQRTRGASRWSACASTSAASPTPPASPPRARPATASILRCLKRHIAREVYKLIIDPPDVAHGADLRRHRTQRGLTIHRTARALGAAPNRISEPRKRLSSTTATSPNATSDTSHRPGLTNIGASTGGVRLGFVGGMVVRGEPCHCTRWPSLAV